MAIFTGDLLLASAKRGITIPTNQLRLSDADILAFADEEIATLILPEIMKLREEFGVYREVSPLLSSQSAYQIPRRAVGRALRDVELLMPNGDISSLGQISTEGRELYNGLSSTPEAFFCLNDKIICVPNVGNAPIGSLIFTFTMRHSRLTTLSSARLITNINSLTGEVTLQTAFGGSVNPGVKMDFVENESQPIILGYNQTILNVAGNVLTFATPLPTDLAMGCYVSLAEETPVVLLPDEAHPVVSSAVQCRVLQAQGDNEGYGLAKGVLNEKLASMRSMLQPRVTGENKFLVSSRSVLRS